MERKTAKELHADVEHLREDGHPQESLKIAEEAKNAYIEENNMLGLSDLYGSISLAYRHLGDFKGAITAAEESVKIAKENDLKGDISRPLFNLAKVQEDEGEFSKAAETYKESVLIFKTGDPKLHNRSGVLADMNIHLATCEYKAGDKNGLKRALDAIKDLENSDERDILKYNYIVWLSGAYMRIASMLQNDNHEMAVKYLNTAKTIINDNIVELPNLEIRKGQWEKIAQRISKF